MKHIIKRKGHSEAFDERKIYASVYAAAMIGHYNERAAEKIAESITAKIKTWIDISHAPTSDQLKHKIHTLLEEMGEKEVAFLYKSHMDIC